MTSQVIIYPNGNKYVGETVKGKYHGYGVFEWNDGDKYEGEFKDNLRHGKGFMFYYRNQFSHYENPINYRGDFQKGSIDGSGLMFYNNGALYTGQFRNGMRYGKGRYYRGDYEYVGNFYNNMMHGNGKIRYDDKQYIGEFHNNMKHGNGMLFIKSNTTRQQFTKYHPICKGTWMFDKYQIRKFSTNILKKIV